MPAQNCVDSIHLLKFRKDRVLSEDKTEEPNRRDFLTLATGATAAVGAVGLAWPFVASMAPDAQVRAAGAPVEIGVGSIEPGQAITVNWRGQPFFVRRLTEDEVAGVDALGEGDMKQFVPVSERLGGAEGASEWTVVSASCTHLGCIPAQVENGAEGWFCPCHGSVFDMAGRILRGPAATNLPLPPYVFADEETLIIGTESA